MRNSVALLPATSCLFNARSIQLHRLKEVWDTNTVYVMRNIETDKIVFACSSGDLGTRFAVGTRHNVHHDQRMANLGYFEVINVLEVVNGEIEKKVNDEHISAKAPVWVFK